MSNLLETYFSCPYCFEQISMLLEPFDEKQDYIEDCEVCCQPINIEYSYKNEELQFLNVRSLNG